ncbi:hypothetical protein Tco_0773779 [Tanacetum coccineum]|uniref:Uncharacterized protein n=1 Tax=Tanacetum coccineum TaxID=301880 RepID=A0ABQ4ZQN6_9ASTR
MALKGRWAFRYGVNGRYLGRWGDLGGGSLGINGKKYILGGTEFYITRHLMHSLKKKEWSIKLLLIEHLNDRSLSKRRNRSIIEAEMSRESVANELQASFPNGTKGVQIMTNPGPAPDLQKCFYPLADASSSIQNRKLGSSFWSCCTMEFFIDEIHQLLHNAHAEENYVDQAEIYNPLTVLRKGYAQERVFDFDESFAHVARLDGCQDLCRYADTKGFSIDLIILDKVYRLRKVAIYMDLKSSRELMPIMPVALILAKALLAGIQFPRWDNPVELQSNKLLEGACEIIYESNLVSTGKETMITPQKIKLRGRLLASFQDDAMYEMWSGHKIRKIEHEHVVDSRILLDRVSAQTLGLSNTDVVDYHALLVLINGTHPLPQCCLMLRLKDFIVISEYSKGYLSECAADISRINLRRTHFLLRRNPNGWRKGCAFASLGSMMRLFNVTINIVDSDSIGAVGLTVVIQTSLLMLQMKILEDPLVFRYQSFSNTIAECPSLFVDMSFGTFVGSLSTLGCARGASCDEVLQKQILFLRQLMCSDVQNSEFTTQIDCHVQSGFQKGASSRTRQLHHDRVEIHYFSSNNNACRTFRVIALVFTMRNGNPSRSNGVVTTNLNPFKCLIYEDIHLAKLRFKEQRLPQNSENEALRYAKVHSPFRFTDFKVIKLDELGPIIQKKKNIIVKDMMISLGKRYERLKKIPEELGIQSALPAPIQCNRSLPKGVLFVSNMDIEEPEYGIFFTDVFVIASMIKTPNNARFCLKMKKLIAEHPDQEKLQSKKAKLELVGYKLD